MKNKKKFSSNSVYSSHDAALDQYWRDEFLGKHDEITSINSSTTADSVYTKSEINELCDSAIAKIATLDDSVTTMKFSAVDGIDSNTSINTGELVYNMADGSLYVGDSYGKATAITAGSSLSTDSSSAITWTSPYVTTTGVDWNNWATTATTSIYSGYGQYKYEKEQKMVNAIFEYLKEDELMQMLDNLNERGIDSDIMKDMCEKICLNRHLSEEFILHFIDYFNIDVVKAKYSSEIKSQAYPNLALLVAVE